MILLKNKYNTFLFLFLTILLGFFVTLLYNVLQDNVKYVTLSMLYDQKNELIKENIEIDLLEESKERLEIELANYKDTNSDIIIINSLKKEINDARNFAGLNQVQGQGVLIIINDSKIISSNREASSLIVHDFDIQNIITDLKNAGAEAISINGERVVAGKSKIKCAGPTIQINEKVVAQPFIIKAIGDKYYLEAAINSPNGYANILREWNIFIEVNTSVWVTVDMYDGNVKFKYIKDYEGEIK